MNLEIAALQVVDVILNNDILSPDFTVDRFLKNVSVYDFAAAVAWINGINVKACVSYNFELKGNISHLQAPSGLYVPPSVRDSLMKEYLQKNHQDYFDRLICINKYRKPGFSWSLGSLDF